MPDLPQDLARLVTDLRGLGFEIEREGWHQWPGGGDFELRRRQGIGVRRVRMLQDRGIWEVGAEIDGGWYEPFTALRALDELPHQQRALNHAERRAYTIELATRFTGEQRQIDAIRARAERLSDAYRRWAEGKGEYLPR